MKTTMSEKTHKRLCEKLLHDVVTHTHKEEIIKLIQEQVVEDTLDMYHCHMTSIYNAPCFNPDVR